MVFLVIRVRSDRGVTKKIRDTMVMLNLTRVNHAVLVPEISSYEGMLKKVKDYVTWGKVDSETIQNILSQRGRMIGDKPLTDSDVNSGSSFSTINEFSDALSSGEVTTKEIEGLKPVFRLHPPRGSKGWGGIKRSFSVGGALGYRGDDIKELVMRMM